MLAPDDARVALDDDRLASARILVIDDEEANVRLMERILHQGGFRNVGTVIDPREVMAVFEQEPPDLLALDLLMPHVDGFELMRRVAERLEPDEYLPILVLTADATAGTKQRALAAGANDFLTKPFDAIEVALRIRNLLRTRFLHVDLKRHQEELEERVRARTGELEDSYRQLRRVDEARRSLLSRVINAQEEERRRIAGDIHDDSVQVMTAVGMRMHVLRKLLHDPEEIAQLDRLQEATEAAVGRLRFLLFELHPPALDTGGLAPAIREFMSMAAHTGRFVFRVDDRLQRQPDPEALTILYRIAQEALNNARKHSGASEIAVSLEERDGGFSVRVADDGRGFDVGDKLEPAPGHLGLLSMVERAEMAQGWCRIESEPGTGTSVEAWLPDGAAPPGI
ncbi:MAG: response regulator [Actinobacteria bacterium]|nr:response regulator [Actinomycetota bacterium]